MMIVMMVMVMIVVMVMVVMVMMIVVVMMVMIVLVEQTDKWLTHNDPDLENVPTCQL